MSDPMDLETATSPSPGSTNPDDTLTPSSASAAAKDATTPSSTLQPHAFHYNLPPHHKDPVTGIPYITTFAELKAKELYQLCLSIHLTSETLYSNTTTTTSSSAGDDIEDDNIEDDDGDYDDNGGNMNDADAPAATRACKLSALGKQCARLQAQLTGLEQLKYSGFSQQQLCDMLLHLLNLVMCSVDPETRELYFETVGEVVTVNSNDSGSYTTSLDGGKDDDNVEQQQQKDSVDYASQKETLDKELERPFALPTPTREILLLIIVNILSNKGPLRAVSNASLYIPGAGDRLRLVLHWKSFLRTLLRTAPYLDEHKQSASPSDSHTRQSNIVKRTSQMIRDARHFFDQRKDASANEVWNMVRTDCLYHSHTHACYRGTILLYLFQPSQCSAAYYKEVLPQWLECWTNIDRCPEYDFLWLTLLCRARKHVSPTNDYDWAPIRRRLLTHAQYWLQLPIGGAAMDKSFPRAPNPRSRACPSRLKAFTGANSSYEEGIDFVAKVVKLLVCGLGSGAIVRDEESTGPGISEGTQDVLRFLSFVTPYFNPSNIGSWTFTLGAFLHYFAYELCCRYGATAGLEALREMQPALAKEFERVQAGATGVDIPSHEIVALLHALLPLCQQAIYSKNAHVGRAGEAAMLYLVQIDPFRATPAFIDFAARALDTTAINMSHQAPAALSALTGLIQPSLRTDPAILLSRLPDILRMSLAGIDSNDQHKCIRTLILYRTLTSWIPIGGAPDSWGVLDNDIGGATRADGTRSIASNLIQYIAVKRESSDYVEAIEALPESSLLKQGIRMESADLQDLLLDVSSAMSDWALEFLERVFQLLRASGEREKRTKSSSGVASRHSSADVHQARNFSRVLTECLTQTFSAMDPEIHSLAVRAVERFVEEETLLFAAKDAALVCQAAAAARVVRDGVVDSPGLDALIGTLSGDFRRLSTKTMIYRVRCLAGAVKSAGPGVIKHKELIASTIDFALSSDDRHLLKTGCKLLRHTLATLSESYPISSDFRPRVYCDARREVVLGKSAQLHGDAVQWHVPDAACVEFFADLLKRHVVARLDDLVESNTDTPRSKMLLAPDMIGLRRCLRIIRYAIRGGAGLLLDLEPEGTDDSDIVPYERSGLKLVDVAQTETKDVLLGLRGRISAFLIMLSSVISSDTLYPEAVASLPEDDPYRKTLPLVASDPKVCKECCDISLLLLTRRGAAFRSQEGRSIWKAQKQLATDFSLCAEVDRMVEVLQMGNVYGNPSLILYKDGEDAGKTISRRLLVTRVHLFHNLLQRNASFQVPRRLRRFEREMNWNRNVLFTVGPTLVHMIADRERMVKATTHRPLDLYEGIVDGLFTLCCHSNTQIRASAISVIDYALTRFGWILAPRIPRLLQSIALQDNGLHGKFGVPSCSLLSGELNQQGKRKRLAETTKGVCSILSLPRSVRLLLGSWQLRSSFVQTLCCTEDLFSLLPTEELQKIVHYLQAIFSPLRSNIYVLPVTQPVNGDEHTGCITFILGMLAEKGNMDTDMALSEDADGAESGKAHWRKLLFAAWFLLNFVDEQDIKADSDVRETIWSTCFSLIENNMGQPLQRVALGILGKLVSMANRLSGQHALLQRMLSDSFRKTLARALVFDHKEDSNVGGGHKSQWSSGVENILRDASRHIAPKSLFPFQRTSQSLGSFKVAHSQLIESILGCLQDPDAVLDCSKGLLEFAKELSAAPPSEDQRNQQITAAEIFAGVCSSCVRVSSDKDALWSDLLLPHLDDVMSKIPFSLCGAYFDGLRYSLQFASAPSFKALISWLCEKVRATLWQPKAGSDVETETGVNGHGAGTDGFTAQSKWLHLFSAVIIEMEESGVSDLNAASRWYEPSLIYGPRSMELSSSPESDWMGLWVIITDNLVPFLTEALGHPFESCRDHIARALFWICYCYRRLKQSNVHHELENDRPSESVFDSVCDPSVQIVNKMLTLRKEELWMFVDRCNALNTTRRFISYCVHLGEAKCEYSDYVTPLLPLIFEALDAASEDEVSDGVAQHQDESTTRRALEAEVIKAYRYMISDISITAVVSYGRDLDIAKVLDAVDDASKHERWQVRQGASNFLRCFQYAHKFLLGPSDAEKATRIAVTLLTDDRREVSSAGMAALVGILAASSPASVARMVKVYVHMADRSRMKKPRKGTTTGDNNVVVDEIKEQRRSRDQQISVFFLVATVMSQPYDTPSYVPEALEAISKHSFERSAPLGVRDIVKKCCAEYKRTHMSDNWELHRSMFSQEQLEAFEDVTSTPHYYA